MIFLPVCLNITDKKILVVGGGKVALHKISSILKYTKNITVLSPEFAEGILDLGLETIKEKYSPDYLPPFFLIYACTNNKKLNLKIKNDANKIGKLVNICDSPKFCDFTSPAIHKIKNMSVAVSSNSEDVKKSIKWRDKIKELISINDLS